MRFHRFHSSGGHFRSLRKLFTICTLAACGLGFVPRADATFHLFAIDQIYSNADGTVQFVVLFEASTLNGENLLAGQSLFSSHAGTTKVFTFPFNLPSSVTARKRVLIGTQAFAALGLVTPDYVIPNGFLDPTGGYINYADVDTVVFSSLPTDGVNAINRSGQIIPNVATNFSGQSASVALPSLVTSYEGLWWNAPASSESGWGINFEHQGDIIFATWFTYDATGKAWWLSMTANKTGDARYSGTLYQTQGPAFNAVPFSPGAVTVSAVGTGTLTFSDSSNGSFAYTVSGISQTKAITRQVFGSQPACSFGNQPNLALATNYQGLWWNAPSASESGWGINFAHQGDTIFATWFTYALNGAPLWLSVTATKMGSGIYSGTLFTKFLGLWVI